MKLIDPSNAALIMIIFVAGFIITTFPTMIENSRKAFREFHLADFERILLGANVATNTQQIVTGITNLIERHYHHNRVMLLKQGRVFLAALLIASSFFWLTGFSLGIVVTPKVIANLNQNSQSVIDEFIFVSNIPFYVAFVVSATALFLHLLIALYNDLPHDLLDRFNPRRVKARNDASTKRLILFLLLLSSFNERENENDTEPTN